MSNEFSDSDGEARVNYEERANTSEERANTAERSDKERATIVEQSDEGRSDVMQNCDEMYALSCVYT